MSFLSALKGLGAATIRLHHWKFGPLMDIAGKTLFDLLGTEQAGARNLIVAQPGT
jgi:hypothetical protein